MADTRENKNIGRMVLGMMRNPSADRARVDQNGLATPHYGEGVAKALGIAISKVPGDK